MNAPVKSPPYRPVYIGDLLAETALWGGLEAALVEWLRDLQWAAGPLPLDLCQLAKRAKVPPKEFRKLWTTVSAAFAETPAGWICERTQELRDHAIDLSRKRAEAGSKGGAKSKQHASKGEAIAFDLPSGLPKQSMSGQGKETLSDQSVHIHTSVQSLDAAGTTAGKKIPSIPEQLTAEIEEIISAARPECYPPIVFAKWRDLNRAKPPRDWRKSLERFARMERFDSAQWEQQKARQQRQASEAFENLSITTRHQGAPRPVSAPSPRALSPLSTNRDQESAQ